MISLTNHDFQGSGEQWGRYNLPRYYIYIYIHIYIYIYIYIIFQFKPPFVREIPTGHVWSPTSSHQSSHHIQACRCETNQSPHSSSKATFEKGRHKRFLFQDFIRSGISMRFFPWHGSSTKKTKSDKTLEVSPCFTKMLTRQSRWFGNLGHVTEKSDWLGKK